MEDVDVACIFRLPLLLRVLTRSLQRHQLAEPLVELSERKCRRRAPSDYDHVEIGTKFASSTAKPLTRPPLESVPDDRVPQLATRRDPQPTAHAQ